MKPRSDDDVYRQLQELLKAEPSPTFVARLRTGVAASSAKSDPKGLFLSAGLLAAAAALVIAVSVHVNAPVQRDHAAAPPRAAGPGPALPSDSSKVVVTSPAPAADRPRRISNRPSSKIPRVPAERPIPVMVSADDVQAFDRLVRSTAEGTIALSFDETHRERAIAELIIAPIDVKPLAMSENEGVVQ